MDQHILAVDTPAQDDISRLRQRVVQLRDAVSTAATVLDDLHATLIAFEMHYETRIGAQMVELDRLEREIVRLRRRLAAHQSATQGTARQTLEADADAEHDETDTSVTDSCAASDPATGDDRIANIATRASLLSQYRKLVRKFHPDVAATEDERAFNEQAMRRINAAMELQDLVALQRLETQLPGNGALSNSETCASALDDLHAEIKRLEALLAQTDADCAEIRSSSLWRLWHRAQLDVRLLDRLEADLRRDIATARMELRALQRELERAQVTTP